MSKYLSGLLFFRGLLFGISSGTIIALLIDYVSGVIVGIVAFISLLWLKLWLNPRTAVASVSDMETRKAIILWCLFAVIAVGTLLGIPLFLSRASFLRIDNFFCAITFFEEFLIGLNLMLFIGINRTVQGTWGKVGLNTTTKIAFVAVPILGTCVLAISCDLDWSFLAGTAFVLYFYGILYRSLDKKRSVTGEKKRKNVTVNIQPKNRQSDTPI